MKNLWFTAALSLMLASSAIAQQIDEPIDRANHSEREDNGRDNRDNRGHRDNRGYRQGYRQGYQHGHRHGHGHGYYRRPAPRPVVVVRPYCAPRPVIVRPYCPPRVVVRPRGHYHYGRW